MKRPGGLRAILALAVLGAAVLLSSCRGSAEKTYPVTRVSVILPHNDDGYWSLIREGVEEAQAEIGDLYNIDIQISIPQLNYNISQMTDILKQQVAAKVDVIVIQGNEDQAFQKVLQEAKDQGIQVICVDTAMKDFPCSLYIGTDNYQAGRVMGENLARLAGEKARVAVVTGEPGYMNLELRLQGLKDVLTQFPGIKITSVNYDHYDGLTFMNQYHSLAAEADILVCLEGTGGQTLSHTFSGPDTEYRLVVGFDAYTGVESGILAGVVKQDTNQMGRGIVEEIANYVSTGSYTGDVIYTDCRWLAADDCDEVSR